MSNPNKGEIDSMQNPGELEMSTRLINVLIIEDDEGWYTDLKIAFENVALTRETYTFKVAERLDCPDDVIVKMKRFRPGYDVVVMDIRFGGINNKDGIKALADIQKQFRRKTPVLIAWSSVCIDPSDVSELRCPFIEKATVRVCDLNGKPVLVDGFPIHKTAPRLVVEKVIDLLHG